MSNCSASCTSVRSPLIAAIATFALKADVWFRRGLLLMLSPDSRAKSCPLSGRSSTYRPVQIPEAGSERLIGTIRRECLDHVIVFGQAHLRRILGKYAAYYNNSRIHRSLNKDAPRSLSADAIPSAAKTDCTSRSTSALEENSRACQLPVKGSGAGQACCPAPRHSRF